MCEVWLCKEWKLAADQPKAAGTVIYPFQPGQVLGVVKYPRKAADFRDQPIDSGVYTLRYGQQPIDGAHVGTSPTRDFALLLKAADDTAVAPLDYKAMTQKSAQAAGSAHPLLLSMQRGAGLGEPLSIAHKEEGDWWIVHVQGQTSLNGKTEKVALEIVVVGKAGE